MKQSTFLALVAAISLSACAPKSRHEAPKKSAAAAAPTKNQQSSAAPAQTAEVKADAKAPQAPVDAKSVPAAGAKDAAAAPKSVPDEVKVVGNDLKCTDDFKFYFYPEQKKFNDLAEQLDARLKAMKVVTDRLDDSSAHHTKVKSTYQELTKAYRAIAKRFTMPFACDYVTPYGRTLKVSSEALEATYKALRSRVEEQIGGQHLFVE